MRQVPKFAIIGDGRVAKHFSYYLSLLNIPFVSWSRRADPEILQLAQAVEPCSHVLVLIKDDAIEPFIQANPCLNNKIKVHFSGSIVTPLAFGAHPLQTFTPDLYDLQTYQNMPFVLEQGEHLFAEILPGLPNSHYMIPAQLKAYYHSLCVMSGNFTMILWQKFFHEIVNTFQLPKEIAKPYLERTLLNLLNNPSNALTGPLARNDQRVIKANLNALEKDPYLKIYEAFLSLLQTEVKK